MLEKADVKKYLDAHYRGITDKVIGMTCSACKGVKKGGFQSETYVLREYSMILCLDCFYDALPGNPDVMATIEKWLKEQEE